MASRSWSDEDAIAEVRRSTEEQGVPFFVVDPAALKKVATLLTVGREDVA